MRRSGKGPFSFSTLSLTRCYKDMRISRRKWEFCPNLTRGILLVTISCCFHRTSDAGENENNYHPRDSVSIRSTNSKHYKRFGWLKVRPLWMDIEKSCFTRTCIAPYAVQLISMEPNINHTAMFYMDIDDPAPPVDMYFPTPPSKTPSIKKIGPAEMSNIETVSTTANFSVGLFGVDPTYRFPRHCHPVIENTVTFNLDTTSGRRRHLVSSVPPYIISFGADCLNLTFQITVIPASSSDSNLDYDGRNEVGEGSTSYDVPGSSTSTHALSIRTPMPMWAFAVSAGLNAALFFALAALSCHLLLSAKKRRKERLRRQRSSAASSAATTSTYVPACTTPINRRIASPLPPPPLRPPPSRTTMQNYDDHEPKYDVPWTENTCERSNSINRYKMTSNTLPHRQKEGQLFSYYCSADEQKPIGEINCNDRPKPLRRTTTPSNVAIPR